MADVLTYTETLAYLQCSECGIRYAAPEKFARTRREDHRTFYCPNGHPQHFPAKSEAERLRADLERQKEQTAAACARARAWQTETEAARRKAAAARGQVTRIKRRVSKGVCPCCSKTFADLAKHMEGQHPEWSADV